MRVTRESLAALKACPDQLEIFAAEWPDGVEVSEAALLRAVELGLDLQWWASLALPAPLRDECERQVAPLLAEYVRQVAPLLAEYDRQRAPLRDEPHRQVAPLLAEFDRQVALLLWRVLQGEPC